MTFAHTSGTKSFGSWIVDRMHNGIDRDQFFAHRPNGNDGRTGVFVSIDAGVIRAGRYTGAFPTIRTALLHPSWSLVCASQAEAVVLTMDRIDDTMAMAA